MSLAIHGEGEGDGDNGVSNKALPVVDKVVHSFSDLRAHGRRGVERGRNLLSISKGLCICFPSVRIILGSVCGVDGAHLDSRIEVRLNSIKLYESGTPKRNLLLSISNIDSGYCGHLPRCNRGLPRCVVGLPLCICLIILLILDQSGVIAGLLGSNGLLGSYGRVVEVESAVSGFFPAVPCDRIEVVITEEVITVIPINGTVCVVLALDCLNGGLERVNGSGNQMRLQSFNCRGKCLLSSFKSCKEFAIGVERNRTGKKRIYSRIVKGGYICVPSCIRAAVIICSCAILASFYIVELRKSVIVITDNAGSTIVMVGFFTLLCRSSPIDRSVKANFKLCNRSCLLPKINAVIGI